MTAETRMHITPRVAKGPEKEESMGILWNLSVLIPTLGSMWGGSGEAPSPPLWDAKAIAPFAPILLKRRRPFCGALFIRWLLLPFMSEAETNVMAMAIRSARLMFALIWKVSLVPLSLTVSCWLMRASADVSSFILTSSPPGRKEFPDHSVWVNLSFQGSVKRIWHEGNFKYFLVHDTLAFGLEMAYIYLCHVWSMKVAYPLDGDIQRCT